MHDEDACYGRKQWKKVYLTKTPVWFLVQNKIVFPGVFASVSHPKIKISVLCFHFTGFAYGETIC